MNLTWHMAKADLRRLRRPLLLWLIVLAATPVLGATLLWGDGGSARWFKAVVDTGKMAMVVELLMGLALVPLLLHSDPVVGHAGFWMTRPIARARLWRAKLVGLGIIFGCTPLAVMFPWWLVCGYGPREIVLAAGEVLLWQMAIMALALPVAALTNGFSRYFLWLLVVVTAFAPVSVFLLFMPQTGAVTAYDLVFVWSRAWLALAVFLMGGVLAAAWQFHFRRMAQSFALFGFAGITALAVLSFWPRFLLPRAPGQVDEKHGPRGAAIRVEFDQARVERASVLNADLLVSLRFPNAPEDLLLSPVWDMAFEGRMPVQHVWSWSNGLRLERRSWLGLSETSGRWMSAEWLAMGLKRPPPNPAEALAVANEKRRKNGLAPIIPRGEGTFGDLRVQVPLAFAARTKQEAPAYRIRLQLDLTRPKLAGEVPLRVGETLRVGRTMARIAYLDFEVTHSDNVPRLIERAPMLLWDGGLWSVVPLLRTGFFAETLYFVVNRARGNAVQGGGDNGWGRFGTVKITRRELSKQAPWEWRDGKWSAQTGWFEGLTLAMMTHQWEERFAKEITVDKFELVSSSLEKAAR